MSKLTGSDRKALPISAFGLPKKKKYPMPDKSHAADAKGRVTQQLKKGNVSSSEAAQVRSKANKILSEN